MLVSGWLNGYKLHVFQATPLFILLFWITCLRETFPSFVLLQAAKAGGCILGTRLVLLPPFTLPSFPCSFLRGGKRKRAWVQVYLYPLYIWSGTGFFDSHGPVYWMSPEDTISQCPHNCSHSYVCITEFHTEVGRHCCLHTSLDINVCLRLWKLHEVRPRTPAKSSSGCIHLV